MLRDRARLGIFKDYVRNAGRLLRGPADANGLRPADANRLRDRQVAIDARGTAVDMRA